MYNSLLVDFQLSFEVIIKKVSSHFNDIYLYNVVVDSHHYQWLISQSSPVTCNMLHCCSICRVSDREETRVFRGCSQMTSAILGVSDTPWCLCQPIISFWHAPWCFKLLMSFVNCPEPKMIRVCTQMPIMENAQLTIHLLQKGSSWA